MGAIKTNIRKVLAAFLCACLLVTYNPAFGTSGTAFADEGDVSTQAIIDGGHLENVQGNLNDMTVMGSATTDAESETTVNVITFENKLEAACGSPASPLLATVDQLKAGKADSRDVSYIWFEVTGGTPASGSDPYNAQWAVYDNGNLNQDITNWFTNQANGAITGTLDDSLMKYQISLQKFANATNTSAKFEAGHEYSFVGRFADATGQDEGKASCQVTLYVASQNTNVAPFHWGHIPVASSSSSINGVDVEAMRADSAKLVGDKLGTTDAITQAMQNQAAADTMAQNATGNYVIGDVLQLNVSPAQVPGVSDGLLIPPFVSNNMIVRLPIHPDYTTAKGGSYGVGDTISVLWTGGSADEVVAVDAKVVHRNADPNDATEWYAELVYPYSNTQTENGIDATGWEALPGTFAIEYNTQKLKPSPTEPTNPITPGPGGAKYFHVDVNVMGGGTVSPSDEGGLYWKVSNKTEDAAKYSLTPMEDYELSGLELVRTDDYAVYDFLDSAASGASAMGSLNGFKSLLTLKNAAFAENSTWRLDVTFTKKDNGGGGGGGGTEPVNPEKHDVKATASLQGGGSLPSGAGVVLWYSEGGDLVATPNTGTAAKNASVKVLSTTPVTVDIIEPAPIQNSDGSVTSYKLAGITMNGEEQVLQDPFMVPALPSSMPATTAINVAVTFVKMTSGVVTPEPMYTVTASVLNPEMGGTVDVPSPNTYGGSAAIASTIKFHSNSENRYLDYVNVYVEGNDEPAFFDVNPEMKQNYDFVLSNYHANVHVEGYFSDKDAPSIELMLSTPDGHGRIVPMGAEATGQTTIMVQSGQSFPLSFQADPGYVLDDVLLQVGNAEPVSQITNNPMMGSITGNIWNFVPVDTRTGNKAGILKLTAIATFKEKSTTPGPVGPGPNPENPDPNDPIDPDPVDPDPDDPVKLPRQLNVYVADASLKDAPNLSYIFGTIPENGFVSDSEEAVENPSAAIAVQDYSSRYGVANGETSLFASVPYNDSYPLNLYGNKVTQNGTTQEYAVEKILVVSYTYANEDGVQVKKGMKWSLYNWNIPAFEVPNILSDSDVIVYFAPVKPLDPNDPEGPTDPKGPGGGFTQKDFVHLTVESNVSNMVTPSLGTDTPVLKGGGQLPIKVVTENSEYTLNSAMVTPKTGTEQDITAALLAAATGAGTKTAEYTLQGLLSDTTLVVNYTKKTTVSDPTTYKVGAKLVAKDSGGATLSDVPCSITLKSGANVSNLPNTVYLNDGNVAELAEGSAMQFMLQRANGFKLKDVTMRWTTGGVYAYVVQQTLSDGSVKNILRFTNNRNDLVGKQVLLKNNSVYANGTVPDESMTYLYVENLICDLTIEPTYEKTDTSGGTTEPVDPSDPNHPENPNNPKNSWTITTKVGNGLGEIFTDSPNYNGSTTRVLRGSVTEANPLTITMTPEAGFRIKDVKVSASSDNPFIDFWTSVFSFISGSSELDDMKKEAIANGFIKLKSVTQNYDVVVDFEPIPEEYDPTGPMAGMVAVNVVYDPARGEVTPNKGVTTAKTESQQFTASPKKVGDKFFSVESVTVSVGNESHTVQAVDKSSNLVRWGTTFYNMFTVDFSKLTWPASDEFAAATVEVKFSDTPDTPGTGGGSGETPPGTPDPSKPGTPINPGDPTGPKDPATVAKQVAVSVVTTAPAEAGSNGVGAMVSPSGSFIVAGVDDEGNPSVRRVNISMRSEFELDRITVTRDGENNDAAAYRYMQEYRENGRYFSVVPDPGGNETITVYVKQKPISERSYTVLMQANGVTGANAFVSPYGAVSLNQNASQTFSINPNEGVWVQSVTDEYTEDGTVWHAVSAEAGSAAWTRSSGNTDPKRSVTVHPVKVKGQVVDRRITVTFATQPGINHTIPEKETTNIQVQAYGPGASYVSFNPSQSLTNIWLGTKDEPLTYHYSYKVSSDAVKNGYAIYRVQVNGEDVFPVNGSSTQLITEGEYDFTTDNMRASGNSLIVYVNKYESMGSDDPTNPIKPTPSEPDPADAATVQYVCGDGGKIALEGVSGSETTSAQGAKTTTINKNDLFTVVMTPDVGYVLDNVILDNCIVREYNWVAPGAGRTAKVALVYTLQLIDKNKSGRVAAWFTTGTDASFKPWEPTSSDPEKGYDFENVLQPDGKIRVEITPAIGVEALVEMLDDTSVAKKILKVREPAAPFSPDVTSTTDSNGYVLEYDTVSKKSNGRNVRIVVGPVIKWDKGILYTLDEVSGLEDGYTVKELLDRNNSRITLNAADNDNSGVSLQDNKQRFFTNYEITGTLPESADSEMPVIKLKLRQVQRSEGLFPEYTTDDIDVPLGSVRVAQSVTRGLGTITPVAVPGTSGTPWFGEDTEGPWAVPANENVAFKVEAADGYVLSSLSVNNTDAARWFDAGTGMLVFAPSVASTVYAEFVTESSPEAMRTVTIAVDESGHGTIDPAAGEYQWSKRSPFAITFRPDPGYVPYRVWVDGQASYVSPNTSGWTLPASWNDQTFRVQYALQGTTPGSLDYLVQTGQNTVDKIGTSLVKTGDNPWLPAIVLLLLLAGGAAFAAKRFLGASESASRVAKYSVTQRVARRNEHDKK